VARSSGTWSRHGVILFETTAHPEIYRVEAAGGEPRPVTRLEPLNRDARHSAPQFLPDGRHFIYFVESERPENNGVYVGSIDSKNRTRLVNSNASAVYAAMREGPGYLLFARGTTLMGQVLDPAKQELAGAPFVVAQQLVISFGGGLPRAEMAASENGVLAYRTRLSAGSNDLVWFDRAGKRLGSMNEPADYSNPALSPDEHKLAVSRMDPDTRTRDIWLFDFSNGALSRFTFDPADETNAAWSPDGKRIAFNSLQNGVVDIYEKEIAGSSEPRVLLHSSESKFIHDWSPDGKFLLFRIGPVTWALAREGGKVIGPFAIDNARISPNARWVAYTSNQTGRSEVYVQSFPPSEGKWQVSTAGGTEPAWRADGKELFYLSAEKLVAMQVKTDSQVFEPGASRALFTVQLEPTVRRSHYQAASNGRRFLMNVPSEASYPITVAIGWAPASAGSR
jgi:eukaryotic-like serine/threonine-protein kinase